MLGLTILFLLVWIFFSLHAALVFLFVWLVAVVILAYIGYRMEREAYK